jgi:hypothetical protein
MSDVNREFDEIEVYDDDVNEFDGGKDYSTMIGVGIIAAGGALAYEGVKQGSKLAKAGFGKLKSFIADKRKKEQSEAPSEVAAEVKPEESKENVK